MTSADYLQLVDWTARQIVDRKPRSTPADGALGQALLLRAWMCSKAEVQRLVKVGETGQVIYTAETDAGRALCDPPDDGFASGASWNFQLLAPLDFQSVVA